MKGYLHEEAGGHIVHDTFDLMQAACVLFLSLSEQQPGVTWYVVLKKYLTHSAKTINVFK